MRRILLLITDLEIGGTPTVVRELALRLRRAGEVHTEVACLSGWGPVAQQLDDAGIAVIALGASRATQFLRVARQVTRLICDGQIDTVVSFLVHANVVAAAASRSCPGVRFIQSIQTAQPTPRWHWWVQQVAQRSANTVLVPSTAVAQVARERCGVDPNRLAIIPNAVDPAGFERVAVFEKPPIRAGFLGRLDPVKNISALVRAIGQMRDLPIECHIFGDGPERANIENAARVYGVQSRVFLHGGVSRPQDALRQMDVLVLPSRHEGFGLVLIEAMASGVPVVAVASGGALDIIQDGVNGLLIRHLDDGEEIKSSIQRLAAKPNLRRRLIDNGLLTVRQRFSWDVVLPQYHRLLNLQQE